MRGWIAALIALGIGGLLLIFLIPSQKPGTAPESPPPISTAAAPNFAAARNVSSNAPATPELVDSDVKEQSTNAAAAAAAVALPPPVVTPVAPTAESSSLPPETVLENMRTAIRQYGLTYGGNPVGTNAEITKALQGENPKHINFLKPDDGNRVNAAGELVDVWGTAYFFHQLSGTEMEIRSAGPDRKMWTADDLVIQ